MKRYNSESLDSSETEVTDKALSSGEQQEQTVSVADSLEVEVKEDEENTAQDEPQERRRFSWPTREQIFNWAPFWGVILLGGLLRFWGLGDKPLHHDESLHAYFSMKLMQNDLQNWLSCFNAQASGCYQYDPLLHGPFQFHAIALVYQISQWLGAPDHGVNTYTVRIAAATLGTVIVGLPYFLRDRLGTLGAWLACFLLAVSPSMVYFSRFAREDIYMACFTLLLVVSVARYIRERKMRWLVLAFCAFALSYATKEATFLTVAIFGSFLGALVAWELGLRIAVRARFSEQVQARKRIPQTAAPLAVLLYLLVAGLLAKWAFAWMKDLSIYITDPKNVNASNAYVQNLKAHTVAVIPWIGILLGVLVLTILIREMTGRSGWPERWQLARFFDPERQPLLSTVFRIPWYYWFFALLAGWAIFIVLFSALFTNLHNGIGDGIWQGLYYWLQQQQVARGGQPWYYYLMLLPLYEQIGVVFALVGIGRALLFPTRFRLFLVYWFVGNLFIYSWAAEKMPWLMIHLTMPMLLLAALGLEPALRSVWAWLRHPHTSAEMPGATGKLVPHVGLQRRRPGLALAGAVATSVLALFLLLPTLQNMREVTYVHPADGPHEMMIYVQTTTDINIVMAKVAALDQKLDAGRHQLAIGVTDDALWPYAWYLRDYTNVCWNFPGGCTATASNIPVIITGGDTVYSMQNQYAPTSGNGAYNFHKYRLRTWWDEGYKPLPCVVSTTNTCKGEPLWGGVGPLLWLSYGDTPPPHASFNVGLALQHVWQWWWERKPFGSTDGSYDMGLFIRKGLDVAP